MFNAPLKETVMIGTWHHGISFTSQAIVLEESK